MLTSCLQAAQRVLFSSLGENMNTFFVGNHPVGHYVARFPSPQPASPSTEQTSKLTPSEPQKQELAQSVTIVDGEKTFFMKARIMAGQADLSTSENTDIEDFKWVAKEEVEKLVHPDYWIRVKNMLVAQ